MIKIEVSTDRTIESSTGQILDGGEDIEVTEDCDWNLEVAVDICHRIDRFLKERGRAMMQPHNADGVTE